MRNKILFLVYSICATSVFSKSLFATPPTAIELKYENKTLYATISHTSDNANQHYISKIFIQVNEGPVEKYYYHRQVNPKKFETEFPMELKPEDIVSLKAQCSQGGSLETTLVVPAEENEKNTKASTIIATPTKSDSTKSAVAPSKQKFDGY